MATLGKDRPWWFTTDTTGEVNWSDNEEMMPAMINSRITFIPVKNRIMDTVHPVKIPLKCLCQSDVASVEKDLLKRPLQ